MNGGLDPSLIYLQLMASSASSIPLQQSCSLLWWTELPGETSSSPGDGEEDPVPTTAQRYRIHLFPYRVSSDICHPHKAQGQGARMRPLLDLIARTHVSKEGSTWQPRSAGSC